MREKKQVRHNTKYLSSLLGFSLITWWIRPHASRDFYSKQTLMHPHLHLINLLSLTKHSRCFQTEWPKFCSWAENRHVLCVLFSKWALRNLEIEYIFLLMWLNIVLHIAFLLCFIKILHSEFILEQIKKNGLNFILF